MAEINQALEAPDLNRSAVARRYDVPRQSLIWHHWHHLHLPVRCAFDTLIAELARLEALSLEQQAIIKRFRVHDFTGVRVGQRHVFPSIYACF
jgi:hypothetical protein